MPAGPGQPLHGEISITMQPFEIHRYAPLFVVMNAASGSQDTQTVKGVIEHEVHRAGRSVFFRMVEPGQNLMQVAERAVKQAVEHHGVIVAAGGDGTINAVAQAALGHGCAFAVLPQGTFNYFGRTHHIPTDATEAIRLLLNAREAYPVQVGLVNDKVFLVNASLGLYPELLEEREAAKQAHGRSRLVAMWAGLRTLLHRHRHLRLKLQLGNGMGARQQTLKTPTLFVGNNQLQLEQLGMPEAPRVTQGQLAAIAVKPQPTWRMLWLALRGAMGRLGEADEVINFPLKEMVVTPLLPMGRRRVKVATDGEINWLTPPLRFTVASTPLNLVCPTPEAFAQPHLQQSTGT